MKYFFSVLLFLLSIMAFGKNNDAALKQENTELKEKITALEKANMVLSKDIERMDKQSEMRYNEVNTRFADNQWWFLLFVALLAGAFTANWVNTRDVARKQAREEMKETKDDYIASFNGIKDNAMEVLVQITKMKFDAEQQLKEFKNELEELKNKS